MVDTTNEWILQRTGIRERHIVDPGVATSDLARARGARRDRGGRPHARRHRLHRRRHDDARHDLPEHGVHAAGEDRRDQRVGIRPRRGLFGLHVLADASATQMVATGAVRARAGRRRRRDVEHHRLHRSRDVRAVRRRRRRGRCCRRRSPASRRSSTSQRDRRHRRPGAVHAGRRQPACRRRTRPSSSGCTT